MMQDLSTPYYLNHPADPFPPTSAAWGEESPAPGLLAMGGIVEPGRLQEAYSQGIFPWYSEGQIPLWWSPSPRMVLQTRHFRWHRSLQKTLRRLRSLDQLEIRIDHDLSQVMRHCANIHRPGQVGSWIHPDMIAAYEQWHGQGHVHSVEVWWDGVLAGGLYAVNLGSMVFGESMFAYRRDASKLALSALVALCRSQSVPWIDCQQQTEHLAFMGAQPVARAAFEDHLRRHVHDARPMQWRWSDDLWQELA